MNEKDREIALFRLTVLGPLASRAQLSRGERKKIFNDLASTAYQIPYSTRCYISAKTIERWYYAWLRGGFDALTPKSRSDKGCSHIPHDIQDIILTLKQDNPARSLNTVTQILEMQGVIAENSISRASLHRFLQKNKLSKRTLSDAACIERRSFEARHAGEIWHGDVMHGPAIMTSKGRRKVYLVSLIDDASRLMAHSAFCFGETALDIEGVLKQALLKRGIPNRLIIDNGAAYRAKTLQTICAQLEIRLVYCPAYEPEGKGKIERWHRTCREQFLAELSLDAIKGLDELNARLWAWLEQIYHQRPHSSLEGKLSPIERWRQDLVHVRPLGRYAHKIDDYFHHRIERSVKKDGTVSWDNRLFEVPYELVGQKVYLVVDPHEKMATKVESLQGELLGAVHPIDKISNCHRKRQRPVSAASETVVNCLKKNNLVEMAYEKQEEQQIIYTTNHDEEK